MLQDGEGHHPDLFGSGGTDPATVLVVCLNNLVGRVLIPQETLGDINLIELLQQPRQLAVNPPKTSREKQLPDAARDHCHYDAWKHDHERRRQAKSKVGACSNDPDDAAEEGSKAEAHDGKEEDVVLGSKVLRQDVEAILQLVQGEALADDRGEHVEADRGSGSARRVGSCCRRREWLARTWFWCWWRRADGLGEAGGDGQRPAKEGCLLVVGKRAKSTARTGVAMGSLSQKLAGIRGTE
ncbi:uncharacterized protein BJ171DRAFT_263035, partial [Polychytrium aggregatum]|uniref:uncharacterized protein n=1 Tax=Polychytrium aggregatum TaxID=110093 RepID=UPI0022FE946C